MHTICILTSIILKIEEKILAQQGNHHLHTSYYIAIIFNPFHTSKFLSNPQYSSSYESIKIDSWTLWQQNEILWLFFFTPISQSLYALFLSSWKKDTFFKFANPMKLL